MAGTRGSQLTPAQLEYGIISYQNRKIWKNKVLKANDIVYSFQNIDAPINHQPAHEALSAAAAVTSNIIKKGIIVIAPDAANNNLTLSATATLIDGLFNGSSGSSSQQLYDGWKLHIINTDGAAQTATLVAADGSTVIAGNAVVAAGSSASFDIYLSAANTLSVLRAS